MSRSPTDMLVTRCVAMRAHVEMSKPVDNCSSHVTSSQNAGCTSGRCDHKKCRPVKSHHTSAPGPTSTPTATGTGTPTSTGSPAGTSFKATETPTGTDLGTSTPTGTDSGTAASTDTGTTSPTATTTPQDTPVNPGELFYSASEGGSDVDTKFGYLNEIDGDNKVHSSSLRPYQGIYEQWLLTPDGYLQGAKTGNVLSTDGRYITTEDQTAAPDGVYPYVCTQGQTVPASGDRGRGTELYCVAAGRYGALLVCQNGDLESDSTGCADRMLVQTINTLYMVEPAGESRRRRQLHNAKELTSSLASCLAPFVYTQLNKSDGVTSCRLVVVLSCRRVGSPS